MERVWGVSGSDGRDVHLLPDLRDQLQHVPKGLHVAERMESHPLQSLLGWFHRLSDRHHQATEGVCQPGRSQHSVTKTRVDGILSLLQPISSVVIKQITFSQDKTPFPDPDSSLPKAILKTSRVSLCACVVFFFF